MWSLSFNSKKIIFSAVSVTLNLISITALAATENTAESVSSSQKDLDYGEMYVVQKHEAPSRVWEAALSYTYGFSNPYLGTHGTALGLNRQFGDFILVGASGSYFLNTESDLASDMQANLGTQGISTKVYKPKYNAYANFSLIPLAGMLNWFGIKSMTFDLVMGFGAGVAGYQNHEGMLPTVRGFITPKLMLNQNWGLMAGVNSSWDQFKGNDWQNRVEILVGALARF